MGKIIFNDVTYSGGGALPEGGVKDDILVKQSAEDGDAKWQAPPPSIDAYTRAQTDALLDEKSDKATTYTKSETDALLDEKAALTVSKISTAGGGQEIHATVSQGQDAVDLNYYKKGETPDYINLNVGEDSFRFKTAAAVDASVPFIATYESTTYEDVKAAIDENRAIVVDFPNNHNIICVTFATYATGQNIVMSGIYKFGDDIFVTGLTLTPANAWSISNSGLYDKTETDTIVSRLNDELGNKADKADTYTKTEVDALIPDVSDFATQQDLTDGLALKADAATTYTKTETDALLADKADAADLADYYTKTQADALLDSKADASAVYTKGETDTLLADKADADSVYDKTETDALLAAKADASAVYTKTEADALLADKADSAALDDYYTKTAADALLDAKADKSTTYTKSETDALLDTKADKADLPLGSFLAVEDETTYEELKAAIDANKAIYVKIGTEKIKPAVRVSVDTTRQKATVMYSEKISSALSGTVEAFVFRDVVASSVLWVNKIVYGIANSAAIGKISDLTTTAKKNLVAAINEVNGKTGVNIAVDKETWYGTYTDENNVTYQVYTKTVYIPALPATAGITTYQHGITGIKQILSVYGFTTDGFVLNAPRQTTSDNIAIYQVQKSATGGIAIEVGKDRSSKSAYVTLIYAKNN